MADGGVAYGSLPFAEQIAFFRAKKNVLTDSWTDLWEQAHDTGFMVAGANRIDLLTDLRAAVDKAIAQGTTLGDFRKDFDAIVSHYGWDHTGGRNWRSRVIYETNLRTSYAAGRWSQLQALVKVRPYWRYRHSDSVQHPRPQYLAWNSLVLPANHPWWMRHFPPNGWGCQCTVEALNLRDLKRLGKDGPDEPPAEETQTVVVGQRGPTPALVDTPAGVDPGFGYAPGRSAFERLVESVAAKSEQLPAHAGAQALAEPLALARAQQAVDRNMHDLVNRVVAKQAGTEAPQLIGALSPELVDAMAAQSVTPALAPIRAGSDVVAEVLAGRTPAAVAVSDVLQVPTMLRTPKAVLLAPGAPPRLLYVSAVDDRTVIASIQVDVDNQLASVETGQLSQLRDEVAQGRLTLVQGTLD